MAEFTYNDVQTIAYEQPVPLNTAIACNKGYVYHRNGSGIVTLRGIVNNPCAPFARYRCQVNANIALPANATVGEIGIALSLNGEVIQTSTAVITPAATEQYGNVTSFAIIDIPKGCCETMAVENVSVGSQDILIRNTNLEVTRIA